MRFYSMFKIKPPLSPELGGSVIQETKILSCFSKAKLGGRVIHESWYTQNFTVCVVVVEDPPPPTPLAGWFPPPAGWLADAAPLLADPTGWLPPPMDGWGARPLRWLSVFVFVTMKSGMKVSILVSFLWMWRSRDVRKHCSDHLWCLHRFYGPRQRYGAVCRTGEWRSSRRVLWATLREDAIDERWPVYHKSEKDVTFRGFLDHTLFTNFESELGFYFNWKRNKWLT